MEIVGAACAQFRARFGSDARFAVRAPGRVNLIGEHTDYNEGFVFPAAIPYDVVIAGSPRADRIVRAWSLVFEQESSFSLDEIRRSPEAPWSDYLRGVAAILQDEGFDPGGMDSVVAGTVPIGSGLSSSAAIEIASVLAFEAAAGFAVDPVQRALIGQRAEREFVGVQCGIMDQFISSLGRRGHALFIDTRTLEHEAVPLPEQGFRILVSDTRKQRGLVDSEYNARRRECERAVELLRPHLPGIRALRDVTQEDFARHAGDLPDIVRRRARHVVTENARVLESVAALKAGDLDRFGRLMNESHESLRHDYEVSSPELDALVEEAHAVEGVLGSRMTGAGFGGCTVSLVAEEAVDRFQREVGRRYWARTGLQPLFYVCTAAQGAARLF